MGRFTIHTERQRISTGRSRPAEPEDDTDKDKIGISTSTWRGIYLRDTHNVFEDQPFIDMQLLNKVVDALNSSEGEK